VLGRLLLLFSLLSPLLQGATRYLFTSFRGNGETGVYLAESKDGLTWLPANGDQPILRPSEPGMLMRDPWLGRGPDGTWHLLWTWGWSKSSEPNATLKIGHATSRDLTAWSAQQAIPVLTDQPLARNAWAPEAVYNPVTSEWTIFWATTIAAAGTGYDHRIYSIATRDWRTFTPARKFFDPGFSCIDATILKVGGKWLMVFKDERNAPERKEPLMKRLRLAWSNSPEGPWTNVSEPFTEAWVEGPTVLKLGRWWWIYFDHYTKPQHYGAVRTLDWKHFEDMTRAVHFPAGQRHGTAVRE
jgi:hypothetical protein